MKKFLATILTASMTLSLAACGGTDTASTGSGTTEGGTTENAPAENAEPADLGAITPGLDPVNTVKTDETLTISLASEPSSLYGAAGGKLESPIIIINQAMLDSLVTYDYKTNELKPNLATEWEWVDGTHLKLDLRDDVTMSDGTPLVADDVVYTVNEVWVGRSANNDVGRNVVGAVAEDEDTVVIEFNMAAPDFEKMISMASYGIVSEDEVNAQGGLDAVQKNPIVGSGKYKFKEWVSGQYVELERNDNYWNPDYAGYYKTLRFNFIGDSAARVMAVESGDSQVAVDVPTSQAATNIGKDSLKVGIYPFGQEKHLWYNMGEKAGATKDQKVREAIDKALNFDAIAQVSSAGTAGPSDSYWESTSPFYSPAYTAEERAVDIEGAKALLAEAGYADGLELKYLTTADGVEIATVIQANLAEIGIKMNIETPDIAQFVEGAFGGDYDLIMVGDMPIFRTQGTIMPFLQKVNVDGPGKIIGGPKWTTDEIDAKINAMITEPDMNKAAEIAKELDAMMKAETITSNICPDIKSVILAPDVKGFNAVERGYIDVTSMYK